MTMKQLGKWSLRKITNVLRFWSHERIKIAQEECVKSEERSKGQARQFL